MTSIVSEKSSGFLSVTGDGRSGNTRFIEKLLVSLSDDEWFVARLVADEKTALEPFFLLRQLINLLSRDITDVIESDERGPQAVEFLKNALGLSAVIPFPESSRYAPSGGIIKEVLTKAIEKRNEKQPLLVVADDFHRADSASVKYLEKIVAKLVGVPLAVVVIHDGSYTTSPAPKEKITLPVLEDVATDDSALERYDILGETAKTIVKLLDVIRMPISSREISRILDINDIEEIETLLHGLGTAGLADKLITSGDVKYRVNESLDIEALSPDEPNNEEIYRRALTVLEEKGCTYDTVKAS
ncbi:MAG: ATP-binding protein, partial [bacterium]|nr:ATP-binding protein [bacterium]